MGFEPTQVARVKLESIPLDHSGKLSQHHGRGRKLDVCEVIFRRSSRTTSQFSAEMTIDRRKKGLRRRKSVNCALFQDDYSECLQQRDWDRSGIRKKGLRGRNSPMCTLSQNGYGDSACRAQVSSSICASIQLLVCVVVLGTCVALYRARRECGVRSTLRTCKRGRSRRGLIHCSSELSRASLRKGQ